MYSISRALSWSAMRISPEITTWRLAIRQVTTKGPPELNSVCLSCFGGVITVCTEHSRIFFCILSDWLLCGSHNPRPNRSYKNLRWHVLLGLREYSVIRNGTAFLFCFERSVLKKKADFGLVKVVWPSCADRPRHLWKLVQLAAFLPEDLQSEVYCY